MKKFFAEQITEKERHGMRGRGGDVKAVGRYANGVVPTRSIDPEPGEEFVGKRKMSMRRGTKSFSDFLTPLRSFLQSNVGRKWDDVYSEISEGIPSNSMQGRHIRSHVTGYVDTDVILIGGVPHSAPRFGSEPRPLTTTRGHDFYVHPETGLLEQVTARSGMYLDTAGRWMYLETWVEQHFGKSPHKIESILSTGRNGYGKPPTQEDIYRAMNKVGRVDDRGLLRAWPKSAASVRAAGKRYIEKQEQEAKLLAAKTALERSNRERKAAKKRKE